MTRPPLHDHVDLTASTRRLVADVDRLDDATARRPSLLPDWSVGHVLTHIARNADAMTRLVDWARTGVPTPMYPSAEARAADIEAGAGRSAADLAADVRESAARLEAAFGDLLGGPDECLERLVAVGPPAPGREPDVPAHSLFAHRQREVEIHHVDLGLPSYGPLDWPDEFVDRTLLWIHGRRGPVDVVGHPGEVLAWRIGRGTGPTVRRHDGGEPGEPGPW